MIARGIGLALAAAAGLAAATPPEAVREDFEGSSFPPAGWEAEGSGTGTWNWYNGGGYARGVVNVPPFGEVQTSLYTYGFQVTRGTLLQIRFIYKTDGFTEGRRYVRLGGWSQYVPYTYDHQWTQFTGSTTPTESREYKLEFYFSLSGGSHGMSSVWDLDDVVVTRDNVGVAPASLGRVRALYR